MRIPEPAQWAAWRLYLSLSRNAARVRPLSSFDQARQLEFLGSWRAQYWTKDIAPKDVLGAPLRQFLASSERNRSALGNVSPLLRFSYSTERDVGQADGKGVISEEDKSLGVNARSESSDNSQGECSPSLPVGLKDVSGSGWSKEEVVNWPNAISIGRLLSGPLLAWYISRMAIINDSFHVECLLIKPVCHHCFNIGHETELTRKRLLYNLEPWRGRQCVPLVYFS